MIETLNILKDSRQLSNRAKPIEEILKVSIKGSSHQKIESYEYISTESESIKVKISFEDPDRISEDIREPDYLSVKILDHTVFKDASTGESIDP